MCTARSLRRDGRISALIAKKMIRLNAAFQVSRHITHASVDSMLTPLALEMTWQEDTATAEIADYEEDIEVFLTGLEGSVKDGSVGLDSGDDGGASTGVECRSGWGTAATELDSVAGLGDAGCADTSGTVFAARCRLDRRLSAGGADDTAGPVT